MRRVEDNDNNKQVEAYQPNYMEQSLDLIKAKLASGFQGQHQFVLLSAAYVPGHCDIEGKLGPGLLCWVNRYPNLHNRLNPTTLRLHYAVCDYPNLNALYNGFNIDLAGIDLAFTYPALRIQGVSYPQDTVQITSPFTAGETLKLTGVKEFFNLAKGKFDVEKYIEKANVVIGEALKAKIASMQVAGQPGAFFQVSRSPFIVKPENMPLVIKSQVFVTASEFANQQSKVEVIDDAMRPASPRK